MRVTQKLEYKLSTKWLAFFSQQETEMRRIRTNICAAHCRKELGNKFLYREYCIHVHVFKTFTLHKNSLSGVGSYSEVGQGWAHTRKWVRGGLKLRSGVGSASEVGQGWASVTGWHIL